MRPVLIFAAAGLVLCGCSSREPKPKPTGRVAPGVHVDNAENQPKRVQVRNRWVDVDVYVDPDEPDVDVSTNVRADD